MRRRDFLRRTAEATAALPMMLAAWPARGNAAEGRDRVAHILSTVNHRRMRLKVSMHVPQDTAPRLQVDGRTVEGVRVDSQGYCWAFDQDGLEPATNYILELTDTDGQALCKSWPLKTFPAPDAQPEHMRLLAYTCAGGHDGLPGPFGIPMFIPLSARQRLLQRGLSFRPDAVVANGDHVYWDLRAGRTAKYLGGSHAAKQLAGEFDREADVLGTPNEDVLRKAAGPQIAELYGRMLQSTPVFFFHDDHDYFENDDATEELKTMPPDAFSLALGRTTQAMYYPEFLPDTARPTDLPATGAPDRAPGLSECFGTLRFGTLFEGLLYDCRRFLTLEGDSATVVPRAVEAWLKDRMAAMDVGHVVHFPSSPFGWTAGKWAEWYPDVLGEDGRLTTEIEKPFWQSGWRKQHDRLLVAASAMPRTPLFICGDIHAIGDTTIHKYGNADFSDNPIVSVLSGPLGSGKAGFPSFIRKTLPLPPVGMAVDEGLPCIEENGFLIVDFTPDEARLRFFRWVPELGEAAIDTLKPFRERILPRTRNT